MSLFRNWNVVPTAGSQMLESWTGAAGAIKLIRTEGAIFPLLHGGVNSNAKHCMKTFAFLV